MDSWDDIMASLEELTESSFRDSHPDSLGHPYRYDWFIMDFTGFKTNPKNRVARYHDTLDHVRRLNTSIDAFDWHYHLPPADGAGDQWSDSWLTSNECNKILARRLVERGDFPEAFRAGGTIEDDIASLWLEQVFLLDFSNRVSERSYPGADLFHFNWYGAPDSWGSYHPSHKNFLVPGQMRRFVYRCTDLRSRYNDLSQRDVDECFEWVRNNGQSAVLSYFSHDNRDMRPETYQVYDSLVAAAAKYEVPWMSCSAKEAHQLFHNIEPRPVVIALELDQQGLRISTDKPPFQSIPFVGAGLSDGEVVRLFPKRVSPTEWELPTSLNNIRQLGVAATSQSGDKAVVVKDVLLSGSSFALAS